MLLKWSVRPRVRAFKLATSTWINLKLEIIVYQLSATLRPDSNVVHYHLRYEKLLMNSVRKNPDVTPSKVPLPVGDLDPI